MASKALTPELIVKVTADRLQVQDDLTKVINKAVGEINKKQNNDNLTKVKVQLDQSEFQKELSGLSGKVDVKSFDGVGEKIGKDIAASIKAELKNLNIGGGTSVTGQTSQTGVKQSRNDEIKSWAQAIAKQQTTLFNKVTEATLKAGQVSEKDLTKLMTAADKFENDFKDFISRMTRSEKGTFTKAMKSELAGRPDVLSFFSGSGSASAAQQVQALLGSAPASGTKFSVPKLQIPAYVPLDQNDLSGISQPIAEAAKNIKVESQVVSQANKTADDHAEIMKLAAEAEKAKASQSQQTGDAIRKETQAVQSSNNALKQHAEALADANKEGEQAEHIASMYGYTIAQGISANAEDVKAIAELAKAQEEAGYELQSISVDKAFDNDGITNLSGSLKYYNKELQTTISQSYTAVKARDQEEQGVYELNLAHERLIKTYKQEKTENTALLRDQADSMKRQFSAQVEAAHQSMDSVLTGNLKSYFSDNFIVDTEDKLKELRRAIQAAKLNLSALEQEAKSGDSFNALTNQFAKLKNVPAQLDKLKTSISRLKSGLYKSDLIEKPRDLNAEYGRLVKTYNDIIDLQKKVDSGEKTLTPDESKEQVRQLRNFFSDLRVLGGETGTQKAIENKMNVLSPEKYNLMFRNLQSNLQKAEQKFDNLVGTTPELESRLNNVKGIVGGIASGFNGSASQMDALVRALKQVSSLNSELVGAKNSPANYIAQLKRDLRTWTIDAQTMAAKANSFTTSGDNADSALTYANSLSKALSNIRKPLEQYEQSLRDGTGLDEEAVKAIHKRVDGYKRLVELANKYTRLAKTDDDNARTAAVNARDLQNLEATLRNFGDTNGKYRNNAGLAVMYDSIAAGIGDLRDSGKIDDVSIKQLRERLSLLDSLTTELGYKGQTYGQRVKAKVSEIGTYFLGISSITLAWDRVRQMIMNVVSLDDAMTDLRKVTEETDATYERFLINAAARAKTLGATMSDVVIATSTFARMGYTLEQSENLGDAALIAQNVWDSVGSIDETANTIISTMKAFGVEAEDAISIVDKLNAVSNSYAVVSGDIANALADAGSALQAAGNTFDESIALFSSTNEIIQDWSKTATALRTIAARIRNTSGELEAMELDADGAAESVTQLQQKIYAKSGVNIFEKDNETFKSTIQILRELSQVWGTLSDVDKAEITRLVAGTRQQSVFAAIMSNFDTVDSIIETSMNSAGSAMEENERYLDSITGKIALLKSAYQSLSETMINSNGIKFAVDGFRGFVEMLEKVASISSGGAITSVLGGVMTGAGIAPVNMEKPFRKWLGLDKDDTSKWSFAQNNILGVLVGNDKNDAKVLDSIAKTLQEAESSGRGYADVLDEIQSRTALLSEKNQKVFNTVLTKNVDNLDACKKGVNDLSKALANTTITSKLKGIAAAVGNVATNMLIGFGIGLLADFAMKGIQYIIEWRDKTIQAGKDVAKQWKESAESLKEAKKSTEELKDSANEFEKLSDGVSEYGQNISLTNEEFNRYREISDQIAALFPALISGYDEQGNAIVKLRNGVADLNAEYEKMAEFTRAETASGFGKSLKGFNQEYFRTEWYDNRVSSYDELQVLEALRSGRDIEDVKRQFAMRGEEGATDYRKIEQALQSAGYKGLNDYSGWNSVAEDYYITLEHQFEQAFNDQVIPGLVAYLQGTDTFKQLDTAFQNGIIQLVRNLDPDAIVNGSEDAWRDIINGITSTLTDEKSAEKFHKALTDMLSFDSSSGSHADYIRAVNALAMYLPKTLNSALSGFIVDTNNANINKTLKAYEKFGDELGLVLVDAISESDLEEALSPDFEWDKNAADQSLDAFMAKFDEYNNAAAAAIREKKNKAISDAIKSYNDVIADANRLFAVEETDGVLSDETFDKLKSGGSGLADVLERIDDELTGQHGWKISESEMEKFIDAQHEATWAVLDENDALSKQYSLLEKYLGGDNYYAKQISDLAEQNAKLGDAYDKVANNEEYAYSEMLSLKETFPDLSFEIDNATGKYKLMGNSVVDLMKKNYELIKSFTNSRLELAKLRAESALLERGTHSKSDIGSALSIIAGKIDETDSLSLEDYEAAIGTKVRGQEYIDFVKQYAAMRAEVKNAQDDLDVLINKAPAGELSAEKTAKDTETMFEKYKKQLDMEKNALEAEMELDPDFVVYNLSSLEDYYHKLAELAKNAYNAQELDAVEYQNYLIEVFNGLKEFSKKAYDDTLNRLENEKKKYDAGMVWDRSVFTDLADYYDQVEELNEKRFKENLKTTEEYVSDLVSIFEGRNEMLEKTLSDYEHDITLWQNHDGVSPSGMPNTELQQIEQLRLMQDLVHQAAEKYRKEVTGTEPIDQDLRDIVDNYDDVIQEVNEKNIDLTRTVHGNIDMNNRQVLEWTQENLDKYKDAMESWGYTAEDLADSISTVLGSAATFDDVDIAFSPMLQTSDGAVLLDADTVYRYIDELIGRACDMNGGSWTNELVMRLDTTGLDIDGVHIQNLLADIGESAIDTSEVLHYLGTDGAFNQAKRELEAMADTYGMTVDEMRSYADNLTSDAKAGMTSYEVEHSDMIKDLQTKWWDYESRIKDIQSEMFSRSLSAYEDYISRRNSFASWGADTEIKAWQRVEDFLDESYRNGIITYKEYLEKKLDATESMYNAEKQRQQDYVDAATRIMDKELEALEKRKENYEKQKSNYESTVSAVVDLINEQINKLKDESEELDKQLKLQKAIKAVEEARSQRNIHIYREGQGFEWEADAKEIKNAQESLDELQRQYDLDEQIKALEKYRDAWQKTIDDYQKNVDKQIAAGLLGADWEDQILSMRTDKMESFAKDYGDICDQLSEDVDGSVAKQIKDLNELKDSWGDAIDEIEYQLGRYDELMAFEDDFKNAGLEQRKAMLADFTRSGVQNLQELIDKAMELSAALDALNGVESDYSRESSVVNEMKKNAADWWTSDETRQKALADRNLELGTELGWYRDANGVWWKRKGVRAFANGGVADYTGAAMIHGSKDRPELVLNNRDAGYLYSILHGHGLMPDSEKNLSGSGSMTVTIGDINLTGVNSPETLADAIVKRLPARVMQRINRK